MGPWEQGHPSSDILQALSELTAGFEQQLIHLLARVASQCRGEAPCLQQGHSASVAERRPPWAHADPSGVALHAALQLDEEAFLAASQDQGEAVEGDAPTSIRSRRSHAESDDAMMSELLPVWRDFREIPCSPSRARTGMSRMNGTMSREFTKTMSNWSHLEPFATNPMSFHRLAWESIGMCLVMYDLIVTPLQAFEIGFGPMMYAIAVYWTLEIPLSFFVGYQNVMGVLELRPRRAAQNYLRTWFVYDILLVTCDWVLVAFETLAQGHEFQGLDYVQVGRAVRLVRFVRLVRLLKLHSFVGKILESHSEYVSTMMKILKFVCFIFILAHFIACGWYALGLHVAINGASWVRANFDDDDNFHYRYWTSIHWSLTQISPASMEVTPTNTIERIYTVGTIVVAMIVFSSFISSITEAMTHIRKTYSKKSEQYNELRRYLNDNRISHRLAVRIWKFLESQKASKRERKVCGDVSVIRDIPQIMQGDLFQEVHTPIMSWHPFWCEYGRRSSAAMRAICQHVAQETSLAENQQLFGTGAVADRMFFVVEGTLGYYPAGHGKVPVPVFRGQWVSEAAIWLRWFHQGDATTKEFSFLLVLPVKPLHEVMQQYVDLMPQSCLYARLFQEHEIAASVSDLQGDVAAIKKMAERAFDEDFDGDMFRGMCDPFPPP